MVNGREILSRRFEAYFDPQIILEVNVPGAGVADHFAVARLGEQGPLPESGGQRLEAERLKKSFRVVDHPLRIYILCAQGGADIHAGIRAGRRKKRVDVAPLLRPHVA